jgi:hypothetical protein
MNTSVGTNGLVQVGGTLNPNALNGGATNSQFSIMTGAGAGYVEYIAIAADCDYLLLNSVTQTTAGHQSTPEPRFYGLLLVSLLAIPAIRRRFVPEQ